MCYYAKNQRTKKMEKKQKYERRRVMTHYVGIRGRNSQLPTHSSLPPHTASHIMIIFSLFYLIFSFSHHIYREHSPQQSTTLSR